MARRGSDWPPTDKPDLILHRGSFTTLDRSNPVATAVAIKEGRFVAVGREEDVLPLAGPTTRLIDLKGRRVLPGLIDNHLHIIRGGRDFARFDEGSPPPAMPDWSPVRQFGGYAAWASPAITGSTVTMDTVASARSCPRGCCGTHGHDHARTWSNRVPVNGFRAFWGALGCIWWAV
jgi:hypothetical protein